MSLNLSRALPFRALPPREQPVVFPQEGARISTSTRLGEQFTSRKIYCWCNKRVSPCISSFQLAFLSNSPFPPFSNLEATGGSFLYHFSLLAYPLIRSMPLYPLAQRFRSTHDFYVPLVPRHDQQMGRTRGIVDDPLSSERPISRRTNPITTRSWRNLIVLVSLEHAVVDKQPIIGSEKGPPIKFAERELIERLSQIDCFSTDRPRRPSISVRDLPSNHASQWWRYDETRKIAQKIVGLIVIFCWD